MTSLYLMRHGQTLFNQLNLIQGWCDSPLTADGIAQAKTAYNYFSSQNISFDKIYSSTSERCCDTCELASGRTDYTRVKGLKEFNFGRMEGQPEFLHPNRRPDQLTHEDFYLKYDGESADQVQARLNKTITELMNQADADDTVLTVSHAGAIMSFFISLELADYPELHFSNCCIFHYEVEDSQFDLVEIIDPVNQKVYGK
ncbi:histidine phosphatase family protein [Streptococcus loxodontisalivarius]|uniref:Phosphoglycerate mutase n=1 Tax=Streptococcus loxodontisalivarius TaxID=1349415 RepID=A0ABS2PTB4_9STRE|nr:histidine phosphatase family protein [Streptococcus loxodontisalivarius]MBM7642795.1 putative phosphoglycerate mutase [Streptococcus loxodontisalivarius]